MSRFTENPVVKKDLENIILTKNIDWEKFRNKKIAVTGATGLVGRIAVSAFLKADEKYNLNLKVLAFVRNRKKAEALFDNFIKQSLEFVVGDITKPFADGIEADYLIHGASITASKMMVEQPVETIMTTIEGTRNALDFAARCKMEGVVYLSSMEAYGVVDSSVRDVYEKDLGYIDILNIRSGYSEGKRMAECLCASYASEYQVPVKIARLAATFGAGIDQSENRVFAQFARSILHKENIVLHTKGEKANCYSYTTDAVTGIITLLLSGEEGQSYNVANMDTFCSIREMAEIFVKEGNVPGISLVFDIPEDVSSFGYAPSSIMKLNSEKMMALGWKPIMDMPAMVRHLMDGMAFDEKYC